MIWRSYQLTWQLLAPMHIGFKKIGNLQMTRLFVPAWALWGAFTARLCRDGTGNDYRSAGENVKANMAFTHFFFERHNGERLRPWQEDRGALEWQILGSYASTALHDGYTKEDGSLHETEFIRPLDREGQPVLLKGALFIKDEDKVKYWKGAASRMSLGGERSYGWGRVELKAIDASVNASWRLDLQRPCLNFRAGDVAEQHVFRRDDMNEEVILDGSSEVVVRRLTPTAGQNVGQFGMDISPPLFCWSPGCTLPRAGGTVDAMLAIHPDGYLVKQTQIA